LGVKNEMAELVQKKNAANPPGSPLKKWGQTLLQCFKVNTSPVIKVYHGFGTDGHMFVFGHVFLMSPYEQKKFSTRFWKNTLSLLRLFMIKTLPFVTVRLKWGAQVVEATTNERGYFVLKWTPDIAVTEGWHRVEVVLSEPDRAPVSGSGRLFVPHPGNYAIVSDIDDTFLVSHSAHLLRRLYVLLTRNARTRKPFEGVVEHYRLLATGDGSSPLPRPFFYVSSSEWNLYDYIREFADQYKLPDGVYLLSQVKQLDELWKTGKGKHRLKYFRIARLLITYPGKQFILLGDDTQEDPVIYRQLVEDFPGRIICVYLRHVRRERLPATRQQETAIKNAGVEICYFTHSETAIAHSRKMGLIV